MRLDTARLFLSYPFSSMFSNLSTRICRTPITAGPWVVEDGQVSVDWTNGTVYFVANKVGACGRSACDLHLSSLLIP